MHNKCVTTCIKIWKHWWIQDFHRGGVDLIGGMVSRGGYVLKILYVKTKESEPLGGMPGARPPRSANGKDTTRKIIAFTFS